MKRKIIAVLVVLVMMIVPTVTFAAEVDVMTEENELEQTPVATEMVDVDEQEEAVQDAEESSVAEIKVPGPDVMQKMEVVEQGDRKNSEEELVFASKEEMRPFSNVYLTSDMLQESEVSSYAYGDPSFTKPADGSTFYIGSKVKIQNVMEGQVGFYYDLILFDSNGNIIGEMTKDNYISEHYQSFAGEWDTSGFGPGTYLLFAVVHDGYFIQSSDTVLVTLKYDTAPPVIGSVSLGVPNPVVFDYAKGSLGFAAQARGVYDNETGVKNIQFEIWKDTEGYASHRTVKANNAGGGTWAAFLSVNKPGNYIIDVTGTDNAGNVAARKRVTLNVQGDTTPPVIQKVVVGSSNTTYNTAFAVQAQGVSDDRSGVRNIQFEIWKSNESYSTHKTFKANNSGSGVWAAYCTVSGPGTYTIDVAGSDNAGNLTRKRTTITVLADKTPPVIGKLVVGASNPTYNTGFAVQAQGVYDDQSGVQNIQFEIWKSNESYSTRKIFKANNAGNGVWAAFCTVSGPGTYTIDVAGTDKAGNVAARKRTTITVQADKTPPVIERLVVGASNPTSQKGFAVQAQGVSDIGLGVKNIQFEIWKSNESYSTHKTFKANNAGDGVWAAFCTVNGPGTYIIDVTGSDHAGNLAARKRVTLTVV